MSLISMLGLLLVPLKAKTPSKREDALVDELGRANFALNHWRNAWHVLWAENERLQEERNRLRAEVRRLRPDIANDPQQFAARNNPTSPYYVRSPNAERAMQHQAQAMAYPQHDCTCVPSRADVFATDFTPGRVWRVENIDDLRS